MLHVRGAARAQALSCDQAFFTHGGREREKKEGPVQRLARSGLTTL